MTSLTIIVPCYNEEKNIRPFYDKCHPILEKLDNNYQLSYQILFVDDGSIDNTLSEIKSLPTEHTGFITFSRNFGKEAALYAGLTFSTSEYTAVMDVDLQDPPELLEEMYLGLSQENFDCVATKRTTRTGEPIIRSFFANCFYYIIKKFSKLDIENGARDFRMFNKSLRDAILQLHEYNRFSKGLFPWVGFKTKWLEFPNQERTHGETKWSFTKLFFYALDGIAAFTSAPLTAVSIVGLLFVLLSIFLIILIIVRKLVWNDPVAGWPSMVCIILFTSGIQYFFTGIMGFYIAKIYDECKKRPQYIIKDHSSTKSSDITLLQQK